MDYGMVYTCIGCGYAVYSLQERNFELDSMCDVVYKISRYNYNEDKVKVHAYCIVPMLNVSSIYTHSA